MPPTPYLLISSVCTPYLLSILYLPGSPAWQIKLPFLYLQEGNTYVSAKAEWNLHFVPAFFTAPRDAIALHLQTPLPRTLVGGHSGAARGVTQGPCLSVRLGQSSSCRIQPIWAILNVRQRVPQVPLDFMRNLG